MSASYHTSFLSRDVCVSLVLYGVAAVSLVCDNAEYVDGSKTYFDKSMGSA